MTNKWVYGFDQVREAEDHLDGDWEAVRSLLGGKGANLAEMTRIGVPVPPGLTVTTEACNAYLDAGESFPEGMWEQELEAMRSVEQQTGKTFGDPRNPLLVSCRSGAKFSMPGMMDTVLNIGLNDVTAVGMTELTGDERFVYDAYRRLVQMFGSVVLGVSDKLFEDVLDEVKHANGITSDTDLTAADWKEITNQFKGIIRKETGTDFPQEPIEQLRLATEAVFGSWNGRRAIDYRNAAGIAHDLGTAVNIQTMVFGNMGSTSGTGVAFTRDPATGDRVLYGDYLMNAQGEDVVAGIRNTKPIHELGEDLPQVYAEFTDICEKLEKHYTEMQDVEFTIENGRLWMLQTRDGKRTAGASIKIAVEMANEGLINRQQALLRVSPDQVDALLHPQFDFEAKAAAGVLAKGVNASPGAAVGRLYFDADTAERMAKEEGQDVIMIRPETKPDDVHGMLASKGILTSRGGATSHAAVVARQFGIPAVVGCDDLIIDLEARSVNATGTVLNEGDFVSLDGTTGELFIGKIPTVHPKFEKETDLITLLEWADKISAQEGIRDLPAGSPTRGLQVWANADYPRDAERARSFGAKGIGLCRTEHMFFEEERLPIVQKMILATEEDERQGALDALLPFQREDFEGIFKAMDGLPVIIRLIDPPLHEFLPAFEDLLVEVTELKKDIQVADDAEKAILKQKLAEKEPLLIEVEGMRESNPMMGLRGIRLGIILPGLIEMQVRAIFEAACSQALQGVDVHPEIMIPLTGHVNELHHVQPRLEEVAQQVMSEKSIVIKYKFGTMIEIPRAALTAEQIAEVAQFFSFGTNDLTQMTFGYSRDDAEAKFLLDYVEKGVLPQNPFQILDREGVGRLVSTSVKLGRQTRPDLEVGICGEHGGEPSSVEFCYMAGLNYVSCSPFRVPIARLAAAHAAIRRPELVV
ncbi:MAG: pyruvate, phosphate dikinase [Chloroflexota bacterium]